jgi:hypothetical protein
MTSAAIRSAGRWRRGVRRWASRPIERSARTGLRHRLRAGRVGPGVRGRGEGTGGRYAVAGARAGAGPLLDGGD